MVTVETDKVAVGTYFLTFNAWNVINGITNRTSETVTIIVGLDNDPSGGGGGTGNKRIPKEKSEMNPWG